VYRAIARCHFLEGQPPAAVEALKRALLAVPGDVETRQLLPLVAAQAGEQAATAAWLARLDREGPDTLAAELPEPASRRRAELPPPPPPEPALPGRLGAYQVFFTERHPLSDVSEVARRWGLAMADIEKGDPTGGRYDLAKESFSVVVPATFRPERPAGALVWISPVEQGGLQWPELLPILEERNLIWIGANQSGNTRPKWTRVGLALDALANLPKLYALNAERLYVGGYSGGGRTAATLAFLYPDAVRGTFCMRGVDTYRSLPVSDRPGAHWPAAFREPAKPVLRQLQQHHRFVLLTGEVDYNRAQTKVIARDLRAQGFEHVTYLETPGASHYSDLGPEVFRQVLEALDRR
jgi:pimeloyl-ACP methyl ester carboxylesterase